MKWRHSYGISISVPAAMAHCITETQIYLYSCTNSEKLSKNIDLMLLANELYAKKSRSTLHCFWIVDGDLCTTRWVMCMCKHEHFYNRTMSLNNKKLNFLPELWTDLSFSFVVRMCNGAIKISGKHSKFTLFSVYVCVCEQRNILNRR